MRKLFLSLAALSLLAACGGSDDDGTTNPGTASITLATSSAAGTVARGASSTATLTLGRTNYTGAVALTAEGLPTGVTAAFAPQSLTGSTASSTVTFNVGTTAAPGTSTITLRAAGSGVTDKTVAYALTVQTPAITVTAGSATATTAQGAATTVPITITRTNGATGTVTLTAENLPANVTASFAPATIADGSTTSTLTLTAGATATVATSNVTVRAAAAGVTDQTATIALTITSAAVPAFTMTAAPAALTVVAGQNGTSTLTITKTGGFAANVGLALEGAPTGVTGVFAPNPATGTTSTLTLTTTGATVPGTYNLTVRGTSAGLTDRTTTIALTVSAAPGVSLTLLPTALTIAQGASAQSVITVGRLGGLTGDVQLSATSAAGITTAFAPATVTGTSSTLTVTVGGAVAAGTSNVVITATGVGGLTTTLNLPITVTVAAGFTLGATNAVVVQGAQGTSTVTITRTGAYANNVDLTATGVPANVTAAFAPSSAPGTQSTLTFTAANNATPGTYTVTVNGTGTGATAQSTTLTLTVTANGTGAGSIAWRFCDPARIPLWFAFRDGATGAWTRVTVGANNTYNFTLSQSVGGVAYVLPAVGASQPNGVIQLFTAAELTALAAAECTSNPTTKTLTGTVAGLTAAGQAAYIGVANSSATVSFPLTTFTLNGVDDVMSDLLAFRATQTIGGGITITPDKAILRRSVNYANNSAIPLLDFNAAEAFTVGSATLTLANSGSDLTNVITNFITANGTAGAFLFGSLGAPSTSVTQYGVPSSRTQAGDFHLTIANAASGDGQSTRQVLQYNRDLANRTITFGSVLNAPTITVPGTAPYARVKSTGTWQAEYGSAVGASFTQTTGGRGWTVSASRGYFGGASTTYELELFDFSALGGFNSAWGLASGAATTVATNAISINSNAAVNISEGLNYFLASRIQTVTP